VKWKTLGIGEVVDANRMASTEYKLNFRTDRKNQEICSKTLTAGDLGKFRQVGFFDSSCVLCNLDSGPWLQQQPPVCCLLQAVEDDWYFQMYYDDLPVWGFIGKMEKIIKQGTSTFK
jgi:hypothetical protein